MDAELTLSTDERRGERTMQDLTGGHEDEKPMIPDELTPRQQAEDPVANAPEEASAGARSDGESADDEDQEPVDDRP
ncbi:hypothetical protein ACI7YT_09075 [Microbacterium sp. M]|uniref:hypothetical protein n=1 Tax=Microbacterium sp. M TaxID=3377125 RepID=UPI003865AB48